MNAESDNESESSLPTQPVHIFPSSPPVVVQSEVSFEKLDNMDVKSEPPATQHGETSKPLSRRVSSAETDRPPSAQQLRQDEGSHADESDEDPEEELDSDPAEKIVDFDWSGLHHRYHDAMKGCHEQEGELTQEWENLMKYFRIWAESGHDHETDRTFKRLKTRTTYVQNSEDTLETRRNHYINVVKAFESALNLLKESGYGS